jgi:Xaa-Pro aminopeptidase
MAYYDLGEFERRLSQVRDILERRKLDCALVYYDEFNLANAWYLTGWCPQFESGAVMVPVDGEPMILGGPESEPFAKMDSAIKVTRNLPVFMVPDEEYPNAVITSFGQLFKELSVKRPLKRAGIVGSSQMPVSVYRQIEAAFHGVEMVDVTEEYGRLRYVKSPWEIAQIRKAHQLADVAYDAMVKQVKPGAREYEVAAAGEYRARAAGANGFGFKAIVGSGRRSNAVVPTAGDKAMEAGETVMLGISPRWNGYSGVVGDTVPVSGKLSALQKEALEDLKEVFRLTREKLRPGTVGKEIDAPGRDFFKKHGYMKYLVCPFAHTLGLNEAEQPFFGPNSSDILAPSMIVSIDVSFFGHPELNGMRLETAYEITDGGPVPLSPRMDSDLTEG